MAIEITCDCGQTYQLKDEFDGQMVQCPKCGTMMLAEMPQPELQADPVFDRDTFLLRQKHLAISEKYYVWDENKQPILFVRRPSYLFRRLLAIMAGIVFYFVCMVAVAVATGGEGSEAVWGVTAIVALVGAVAVGIALQPKRHVTFYRDDTMQEPILQILQDKRFQPVNQTYTLKDAEGNTIARFRKNVLYNFFRKRWYCTDQHHQLLCTVKEDSLILSLLRRVLQLGILVQLVPTNFIFYKGDATGNEVFGEFNRKFTILDRYALDMKADKLRAFDRRVALALGVMLDTGERR